MPTPHPGSTAKPEKPGDCLMRTAGRGVHFSPCSAIAHNSASSNPGINTRHGHAAVPGCVGEGRSDGNTDSFDKQPTPSCRNPTSCWLTLASKGYSSSCTLSISEVRDESGPLQMKCSVHPMLISPAINPISHPRTLLHKLPPSFDTEGLMGCFSSCPVGYARRVMARG